MLKGIRCSDQQTDGKDISRQDKRSMHALGIGCIVDDYSVIALNVFFLDFNNVIAEYT
jgi:hypothetical protein